MSAGSRTRAAAGAFVLAAFVLVAGCTRGEKTPPAPTTLAPTTVPRTTGVPTTSSESPRSAFFTALATHDPARVEALVSATVEGSAAWRYATHQAALRAVVGLEPADQVVSSGSAVQLCDFSSACTTYDAFVEAPESGLLESFRVDGAAIDDRVVVGGGRGVSGGVVARVVTAYSSPQSERLAVVVDVENLSELVFRPFGFAAAYQRPGELGRTDAIAAVGANTVAAGARGSLVVVFAGAPLGGTLSLNGLDADDNELQFALAVRAL